ncbi:MAG: mandelate racemase/muconate lactonizing enzyme family protein [Gemmatimonadetes bacterium]|jgi:L-alanine-DL-glutamate epimerase-like enolase superfamily enzyme|nr:mandelate racemase/muconate lactonizing enzyme family protein [Gemmatimonadota bacterium]
MKITNVEFTPSLGPANRNWRLMRISTDAGIVGLGDCPGASPDRLKQILIGRDPLNINQLHHDHLWQMRGPGAQVEIALWDIKGKAMDVPLHELLGGKLRDKIRIYCDCHAGDYWTPEDFARRWREVRESGQLDPIYELDAYAERAKQVAAEGFTAIKFDVDVPNPWKIDQYDRSIGRREHEHIVAILEKVRQSIGPYVDLAVDLHGSFNLADALRVCRDVEHLDLLWLEDPIRWEWGNVDALAKICMQTETPICTGEIFYGAKLFRELLEKQACDLLEPDIPHSGGPIEIRRIAELAEMHHMSIAPHNMSSAVTSIAAVHICSTIPNLLALEYHSHNIPLWSDMLDFKDPIQNGYISVPDGPGLGIELDEEAIAACLPADAPLWS